MASIVPVAALPPAVPFTDHVTVLGLSPFTVAVNCCTCPAPTKTVCGEITTAADAGLIVTVAEADFVVSVLLVAVTVAVVAAVTAAAVNLPFASTVPLVALALLAVQVTPALAESFITVAVNCAVPPAVTVAVVGLTVTEIVFPFEELLPPPQPEMKVRIANTDERQTPVEKSFRMVLPAAWF